MKLKIEVKLLPGGMMPRLSEKGDWIDLYLKEDMELEPAQAGTLVGGSRRDVTFQPALIGLGLAMRLPKGFEAVVALRSSAPKAFNAFIPNGIGIIDNSYQGENDEWKLWVAPLSKVSMRKGERACQFRIQLSQKASLWQKLKWLLSSGVELKEVQSLGGKDRGGIGSTGK